MHSLEQSFAEPRVPGGVQYMSVVTHLSTVQLVFMNRFLVEFLDYLAGATAALTVLTLLLGKRHAACCVRSNGISTVLSGPTCYSPTSK
jgi:hypothetical protein